MAQIEPDSVMGRAADLASGETVVQEFRADRLPTGRAI